MIVGLGKTGLSCAEYLASEGQRFVVCDTRAAPVLLSEFQQQFPDVQVHLGALDEQLLTQAERIILSPGVSLQLPALQAAQVAGVSIVGDVELFLQATDVPIVAITGTNAKGTVATLVYDIAKQAGVDAVLGGNIGIPVLDLLHQPQPELYIVELSSFQLQSTHSLQAKVSTILNLTPDHLDQHRDMSEYITAKQTIYQQAENIVINRDDELTLPRIATGTQWSFGLNQPQTAFEFGLQGNNLLQGQKVLCQQQDLAVMGRHNIANVLAALTITAALDIPIARAITAAKAFTGLPHRCQLVAEIDSVRWYNDSKATNTGACLAALQGFSGQGDIILIAGGDAKGQDLSVLKPAIEQHVKEIILLGKNASEFAAAVNPEATQVSDLAAAVSTANRVAKAGDIVLLSPACSSLDMFTNFEQRGDRFQALVRKLAGGSNAETATN